MGTENFFSHTDLAAPWDRARAMGMANLGGEEHRRGLPTPQAVMDAWMHSSGHRANIRDRRHLAWVCVRRGRAPADSRTSATEPPAPGTG